MARDRDAVDLRDVDGVAAEVLGDVALAGQVGVAAFQRRNRGPETGHLQELERREHAAVDLARLDVLAPAGVDADVRVGEHLLLELLL